MIRRARQGRGPSFLEAVTYRWRGHVGPREDVDVGVTRSHDLASWKQRDPVLRLAVALELAGRLSSSEYAEMQRVIRQSTSEAWARAEQGLFPPQSALLDWVYSNDRTCLCPGHPSRPSLSTRYISQRVCDWTGTMESLVRGRNHDRPGSGVRC
jgi:TPP-dependent pyruvate/acetoin dehydrogenase alpha subunit